jgi:hypothetical protein
VISVISVISADHYGQPDHNAKILSRDSANLPFQGPACHGGPAPDGGRHREPRYSCALTHKYSFIVTSLFRSQLMLSTDSYCLLVTPVL